MRQQPARLSELTKNPLTVAEDGKNIYGEAIKAMCRENRTSLVVSYRHLCIKEDCAVLAIYLADAPLQMLKIFSEVAQEVWARPRVPFSPSHSASVTADPIMEQKNGVLSFSRETEFSAISACAGLGATAVRRCEHDPHCAARRQRTNPILGQTSEPS